MPRIVIKADKEAATSPVSRELQAHENIFAEGDVGTVMYILQAGRVEIFKRVRGQELRLALLEKGDFFGEMAILENRPRTASARAFEAARVLEIDSSTFGQMLLENPEISIRMLRKLSRRLRNADEFLKELGGLDALEADDSEARSKTDRPLSLQHLLCSETGRKFFLSAEGETTIGRSDSVTAIQPDIDLTSVDPQRSTSRRHATIHRRNGRFFLTEEIGTTNGTFIGKSRLQTGTPLEIRGGDRLRFGVVRLTFQTGA